MTNQSVIFTCCLDLWIQTVFLMALSLPPSPCILCESTPGEWGASLPLKLLFSCEGYQKRGKGCSSLKLWSVAWRHKVQPLWEWPRGLYSPRNDPQLILGMEWYSVTELLQICCSVYDLESHLTFHYSLCDFSWSCGFWLTVKLFLKPEAIAILRCFNIFNIILKC